ncbi:YncE family protein [Streptacidiphilus sp. PAMC 29251]
MRTRSTSIATAAAILLGSVVLGISTAATASAATAVTTTSVGGLVADGPLDRVFVGDTTAGTVYAADRNGVKLGSVTGIAGVDSLAVSADGSTVYAASPTAHQIVAIDAATLAVKGRYAIATNDGPVSVAFAAGKLWFSYGDQWDGNLGSVDSSGTVALAQVAQNELWNPELLSASTAEPNELTGLTQGQSPSEARLFDLSSGTPQLQNEVAGYGAGTPDEIQDVDLIPGGGLLLDGYDRMSYSGSSYVQTGTYPAENEWDTADISPGGLVAQVDKGGDVRIFQPNAAQPVRTYATGAASVQVAWDPDGSQVYALEQVQNSSGNGADSYTLKVFTGPTLSVPTLSVKAPAGATRAKKLTVTGRISATVPLPTGVRLTVTRTDLDYPRARRWHRSPPAPAAHSASATPRRSAAR